jgi:LysR family transcriptional regulator, regulator for bpeEF and oprC
MEHLRHIGVFIRAAELGSFSAAGDALGLTGSAASKAVAVLEAALGVPLFARSTRGITLTADGERFYPRCKAILADLADASRELGAARSAPRGTLRVLMHPGPARARIAAQLPRFLKRYPQLTIDASAEDGVIDLEARGFDVAILYGDPPKSPTVSGPAAALVMRRIVDGEFITCAAPSYLLLHGAPREPEDLLRHACLARSNPDSKPRTEWTFANESRRCTVKVQPRLYTNDGLCLTHAAVAGGGIVHLPKINMAPLLASGALVRLLDGWFSESSPMQVLYAASSRRLPKVRAFVDFVVEVFADVGPGTARPPHAHVPRDWPMLHKPRHDVGAR